MFALARGQGLIAINENALTVNADSHPEIYGIGNVLAITENQDLNTLICQRWKKEISGINLYRWGTKSTKSDDQPVDRQLMIGTLIWQELKLDQFAQLDLEERELGILNQRTQIENVANSERVLMCRIKEEVLPFIPPNATGDCTILVCRSLTLSLDLNIKSEWIKISKSNIITGSNSRTFRNIK